METKHGNGGGEYDNVPAQKHHIDASRFSCPMIVSLELSATLTPMVFWWYCTVMSFSAKSIIFEY